MTRKQWRELCEFDLSNSVTDERAVCFLATEPHALVTSAPEDSEQLAHKHGSF